MPESARLAIDPTDEEIENAVRRFVRWVLTPFTEVVYGIASKTGLTPEQLSEDLDCMATEREKGGEGFAKETEPAGAGTPEVAAVARPPGRAEAAAKAGEAALAQAAPADSRR